MIRIVGNIALHFPVPAGRAASIDQNSVVNLEVRIIGQVSDEEPVVLQRFIEDGMHLFLVPTVTFPKKHQVVAKQHISPQATP